MTKETLRQHYTSLRASMDASEVANQSIAIANQVLKLPIWEFTNYHLFLSIENKTANSILGEPDDVKIQSSMTLFDAIQSENDLFDSILEKYFEGNRCLSTLRILKNE